MQKATIFVASKNGEYVPLSEKDHIKIKVDGIEYALDMGYGQIRLRGLNGDVCIYPSASNCIYIGTRGLKISP